MNMGEFVSYTIKGAILLSVMFAVYGLSVSRLKCAALRRAVLLSVYVCALAIPLFSRLEFGEGLPDQPFVPAMTSGFGIPESEVIGETATPGSGIYGWIASIAFCGMIVCLLYFISCLLIMVRYHLRSHKGIVDGQNVRIINGMKASPFCFGRNVYVSAEDLDEKKSMVLSHELSHARHLHFLDLLLGRAVTILQWWNPLAWMMMSELHQVHEFQADDDVIEKGFDIKSYQYMLVGIAMRRNIMPLGNNMAQSRLKSRLRMINRENSSRKSRLLTLLFLPAAFLAISLISSNAVACVLDSIENAEWRPASSSAAEITVSDASFASVKKEATDTVVTVKKEPAEQTTYEKIKVTGVGTVKKSESDPSTTFTPFKRPAQQHNSEINSNTAAYMVDGRIISVDELKKINPVTIKSITVRKNLEEYPAGLILIDLLTPEEMAEREKPINTTDSIN